MMTIFSFGLGQESLALLYKLATDTGFYVKHVRGKLLIVGSDTGNEHPHTYALLPMIKEFCFKRGFNFYWITKEMGFHSKAWQSLTEQYKRNKSIGSAAFRQTCTDNLKVKVVDNFVEHWLWDHTTFTETRKRAYRRYAEAHGKFRLILGFAKGEEHRIENGNKYDPIWKKATVERHYPLLIEGMDRQQCITINELAWTQTVWPSNCMLCFYQSDQEILWLYRNYPERFKEWVEMEQEKLKKYKDEPKNYGVYGKINLIEKLRKANYLYGHWSDEELNDYKFSHGHCQRTTY